jgi:hypothetical protein
MALPEKHRKDLCTNTHEQSRLQDVPVFREFILNVFHIKGLNRVTDVTVNFYSALFFIIS